jgi:hypothetical protein
VTPASRLAPDPATVWMPCDGPTMRKRHARCIDADMERPIGGQRFDGIQQRSRNLSY